MAMEHGKEMQNQRGSATVEAVVGFTAFLFAIFTILGMVNFCRAQMLVSAAVDTAAKEMSQYAYFYEMSGLQKFEEKLDNNGKVGKNNINQVIGTVDQLYSSINGAVEQTMEDKTNLENAISAGDVDMQDFENALGRLENNAQGVGNALNSMGNMAEKIGNDPLLYMRSVVALIGSEGMEAAKRVLATLMAEAFVSKHFGNSWDEANEKLESLGIEGGLSSMNFRLSNIFSDDKHRDIEIVVMYKVKLFQVFDWVVLEAKVSKVAYCQAWLGGDDVQAKATPETQPALEETLPSQGGEGETENPDEGTDEPPPVDIEGSYWYLDENNKGYNEIEAQFMSLLKETYGFEQEIADAQFMGRDDSGHAYGMSYCLTAEDADGLNAAIYRDSIEHVAGMEKKYVETNGKAGYKPGTTTQYTCVIYVPENISDTELKAIEEKACEDWRLYYDWAIEEFGIKLQVNVQIVKAGGNYDYGSEAA